MAERTSVTQVSQIRVETTAGTDPATGTKQFSSLGIDLSPKIDVNTFTPSGQKYVGSASVGKDWTTGKLTGQATYTEIIYPLSMLFGAPTITTPAGGTTSRQHLWTPSNSAVLTPKTLTVVKGSSVAAESATYVHATGFGVAFDRSKVDTDGDLLGQLFTTGASLDGSPTTLALVPVLANQGDVYLDSTWAGLGTTKLTRVISGSWKESDKYNAGWFVNSANPSWAVSVENKPKTEIKLMLEADATGLALLASLRAGSTSFVRFKWLGATIETTIKYTLQSDFAVKWTDIGDIKDTDGVYAVDFTGEVSQDATSGNNQQHTVINTLTAL
jgi:hypothetical protein